MDAKRLLQLCSVGLAFSGVLGCYAVQSPIQTRQVSIPRGMRAVLLRAKLATSTQAGSHVDVMVTGASQVESTILLQDVELAASDHGIVTLLTTPNDAEKLTVACEKGRIELVPHRPNLVPIL